jgi:hypothetical protein
MCVCVCVCVCVHQGEVVATNGWCIMVLVGVRSQYLPPQGVHGSSIQAAARN